MLTGTSDQLIYCNIIIIIMILLVRHVFKLTQSDSSEYESSKGPLTFQLIPQLSMQQILIIKAALTKPTWLP